jgi:hypothetical protein
MIVFHCSLICFNTLVRQSLLKNTDIKLAQTYNSSFRNTDVASRLKHSLHKLYVRPHELTDRSEISCLLNDDGSFLFYVVFFLLSTITDKTYWAWLWLWVTAVYDKKQEVLTLSRAQRSFSPVVLMGSVLRIFLVFSSMFVFVFVLWLVPSIASVSGLFHSWLPHHFRFSPPKYIFV